MMPSSRDRCIRDVGHRKALARKWVELVQQVRTIAEFGDLLRPPSLETLLRAADCGRVVIINISWRRCDALIVKKPDLAVVELPDLSQEDLVTEVEVYLDAVGARPSDTMRGSFTRKAADFMHIGL